MVKELRLRGIVDCRGTYGSWVITAYNTRFGRGRPMPRTCIGAGASRWMLDEILAWREERTVTRNLTLHYDRMMLLLDPTSLGPWLGAQEGGGGELPGTDVRGVSSTERRSVQGVRQDPDSAAGAIVDNKRLSGVWSS